MMIKFPPTGFGKAAASMVPQPCPPDNIIHSQRCFPFFPPCYDLLQNPVLELRKRYINQDETELLLRYQLLYILYSASCLLPLSSSRVLPSALRHYLVSSSLHYVTSLSWNEANSLYTHSTQNLNKWHTQMKLLLWNQLSELSVSATLSYWLNQSVGWTAFRIYREARSSIATIIDCQALWQSGWRQPSPRYWRETQEEYRGRSTSQVDKKIVSWTLHA